MSNKGYKRNLPVPFFSQREVRYRWQQKRIINGQSTFIQNTEVHLEGANCNIVSLAMLLHYYGITDDSPYRILERFFETTGFVEPLEGGGSRVHTQDLRHLANGWNRLQRWWALEQFPRLAYNIPESYIKQRGNITVRDVKEQIKKGNPVMFSYGAVFLSDGTPYSGHIAVIRGFTENNHVIINDPWGDVGTPDGNLVRFTLGNTTGDYGRFFHVGTSSRANYYGLGNGDNSVLRLNLLKSKMRPPTVRNPLHTFNQAMYIEYPHIWSFPFNLGSGDNVRGETFRFSDQANYRNVAAQNIFRNSQVQEMLRSEIIENAGYPISSNRLWHDGIHIAGNGAVHAIGPGRLVAARIQAEDEMPSDGSSNFVLVRHRERINNQEKEFYSHYMHLEPVNISQRIQSKLGGDSEPRWKRDWLDQIIERVMPKRGIVRAGTPGQTIQTFNQNGQANGTIAHNALIFLRPIANTNNPNECVRNRVENVRPDEDFKENIVWFSNAVNASITYIHRIGNANYFEYYHKIDNSTNTDNPSNSVSWETRYVLAENIILQVVNIPEFIYYRRALARLMRGEVVVFAKDHIRRRKPEPEDPVQLLDNTLLCNFSNIDFSTDVAEATGTARWTAIYDARYRDIIHHYLAKVENRSNENEINAAIQDLTERIYSFSKALLAFPTEMLRGITRFKISDNWYGRLISNTDSVYQRVLREAFPNNNELITAHVERMRILLHHSTHLNIDYHIEVNGNTKLGRPCAFRGRNNIIHFEIFSDRNDLIFDTKERWYPDGRQFVKVEAQNEKNDFFNVEKIIEKLRNANFLNETDCFAQVEPSSWISAEEISNYMQNKSKYESLQYAIVQHLHGHAKMEESDWEEVIGSGCGINNVILKTDKLRDYLAYKWFSRQMLDELKPLTHKIFKKKNWILAVFYHPVRFLAWLDEKMNHEANNAPAVVSSNVPVSPPVPPPAAATPPAAIAPSAVAVPETPTEAVVNNAPPTVQQRNIFNYIIDGVNRLIEDPIGTLQDAANFIKRNLIPRWTGGR